MESALIEKQNNNDYKLLSEKVDQDQILGKAFIQSQSGICSRVVINLVPKEFLVFREHLKDV